MQIELNQENSTCETEKDLEKKEWSDIGEIWMEIKKCNKYEVSNLGRIRNKSKGNILSPRDNGNGYKLFGVNLNGKGKNYYIHRTVLETFNPIDGCEDMDVNHKDFDRSNNRLENLEWVNHKLNMQISFIHGRFRKRDIQRSLVLKDLAKAGKHQWSKLNIFQIEEIYNLWKNNEYNYCQLAIKYGVTEQAIKLVVKKWKDGRYA